MNSILNFSFYKKSEIPEKEGEMASLHLITGRRGLQNGKGGKLSFNSVPRFLDNLFKTFLRPPFE